LVGGIGALAAGAGVIGADAASGGSLFGPEAAASTADTAASTSSDVVDSFAGGAGGATFEGAGFDTADEGLSAADTGTAVAGQTAAQAASGDAAAFAPPPGDGTFVGASQDVTQPAAGAATAGGANTAGPTTTATPTAAPAANLSMPPTSLTPAAGTINAGAGLPATPDNIINAPPSAVPGTFSTPGTPGGGIIGADSSGVLGNITGFVQKNPLLAYGVLQAGGSLISGLTSTLTPAQVSALNAQAAANQAAANLTTQQTQNLAQPRSTATLAPVTGTPNNIITPPNAGIINSAPAVNVTGVPA
jgi:hypothetical protein